MISTLWAIFIAGQIFTAGNINFQQEMGYYEINPIYGKHPSKERVYITKAVEVGLVYALTRALPKHEKTILIGANTVILGCIAYDNKVGISMGMRF